MKKLSILCTLVLVLFAIGTIAQEKIGQFDGHEDVGNPSIKGAATYRQGTINVPSWSPDSKRIAFVSNTKL